MEIKELADQSGLSRDTIRYYEKIGLLTKPKRDVNGYRNYNIEVVTQLKMISRAKELGFTLIEIKKLSTLLYSKSLTRKKMAEELNEKVIEIDQKIMNLKDMKKEINKALAGMCEYKTFLD